MIKNYYIVWLLFFNCILITVNTDQDVFNPIYRSDKNIRNHLSALNDDPFESDTLDKQIKIIEELSKPKDVFNQIPSSDSNLQNILNKLKDQQLNTVTDNSPLLNFNKNIWNEFTKSEITPEADRFPSLIDPEYSNIHFKVTFRENNNLYRKVNTDQDVFNQIPSSDSNLQNFLNKLKDQPLNTVTANSPLLNFDKNVWNELAMSENVPEVKTIPPIINTEFLDSIRIKDIPEMHLKPIYPEIESNHVKNENKKLLDNIMIHGGIVLLLSVVICIISLIVKNNKKSTQTTTTTSTNNGQSNVGFKDESDSNTFKILFPSSNNQYSRMQNI